MADDICALIDHLHLEQPDVVGHSLGGGVAFFTAVKCPQKARRMVMISANITRAANPTEMLAQQGQVNAAAVEFMKDTPMYLLLQRAAAGGFRPAAGQDRRLDGQGLRFQRRDARAAGCRR